jgi:hypothetical protein
VVLLEIGESLVEGEGFFGVGGIDLLRIIAAELMKIDSFFFYSLFDISNASLNFLDFRKCFQEIGFADQTLIEEILDALAVEVESLFEDEKGLFAAGEEMVLEIGGFDEACDIVFLEKFLIKGD